MHQDESAKLARTALLESFSLNAALLPAIVQAFGKEATGEDPSVPHAKFLLELLQMQLSHSAPRKSKSDAANGSEPGEVSGPSLIELFRDTVDEITEKPDTQPKNNSTPVE